MTNRQRVEVIILCEDQGHEIFIRSYLKHTASIKPRNIVTIPLSGGYGSAEQKVRENFRNQVEVYRYRAAKLKGGLILVVMVDADNIEVKTRMAQLEDLLPDKRKPDEKILILVPQRNIETWVEYANVAYDKNAALNITKDYKHSTQKPADYKVAAEQFAKQICPKGLPKNAPPSLIIACDELNRIL